MFVVLSCVDCPWVTGVEIAYAPMCMMVRRHSLSHLLIAGCDIGVQISVRPYVRSSVRSFVRQHLRRSLVFSTSEIAVSLKPCIVIVPDIPFKHAP